MIRRCSNRYDHLGRRVQKITPEATYTYFYDGWLLVKDTRQDAASPWKAMGLEAASHFAQHFHCGQVTNPRIFGRISVSFPSETQK